MPQKQFTKQRMASAISVALGTVVALPLYAQEDADVDLGAPAAEERVLEEVVVTGIRSSLRAAMDTKRDSFGVVDAIPRM